MRSNVKWIQKHHSGPHFLISFINFKHNKLRAEHHISLRPTDGPFCPAQQLHQYLQMRGDTPGPLLVTAANLPVTDRAVNQLLQSLLLACGQDPASFGSHSFRIGRVTDLADKGASEEKIKFLARFHSQAFTKYIRTSGLTLP